MKIQYKKPKRRLGKVDYVCNNVYGYIWRDTRQELFIPLWRTLSCVILPKEKFEVKDR